ncbi:ATP-dependent Clp protease ATP-binding subunit homolog CD4B, chloroplastic-like [Olea europaea subsp. europaea]|uniref:ATP-dependent Clp protease ATP-binding subunit homolog CD4B, chloroplastic-like n=1 Tax=Olea europaea subsp. europaea TaxID=158383 RepID=A0A8S0TT21_OLEEU|nr:ATP-dependent Clp protease ATP-binding subunit homolog CD4B, chloroplastic-like [Olea europaea subsp. europaea]
MQRHPESISYAIDIASVTRQSGLDSTASTQQKQTREEGPRKIRFVVNSPSHRRRHSPDARTVSMLRRESRWLHSRESRKQFLNFHMNYFGNLGIGLDLIWINGLMGWDLCIVGDRFLLDKAIDLIDEVDSWVRLCHAQDAGVLEKELKQITKEKYEAIRSQDSKKAGEFRDREMDLKARISALRDKNKEMAKAESEAGGGGPIVTEVDMKHIVSLEKLSTDESDRLLKMEEILHMQVIGQDEAVKAIGRAIRVHAFD